MLEIKDVHIAVEDKKIVKGISLGIKPGEVHAIMGPNGSGKSTLANALMGSPTYTITRGNILVDGEDITEEDPDIRAKKGLFMSFQYPSEVPGVTIANFLRMAWNSSKGTPIDVVAFRKLLVEKLDMMKMDRSFADRYLNHGFSGGEKKRSEILQMVVLQPKYAVLDETDSGADIDSLKIMANGINTLRKDMGILLITHYNRILQYIKPDFVHVLIDGKLVKSGGPELAVEVEAKGYDWLKPSLLN